MTSRTDPHPTPEGGDPWRRIEMLETRIAALDAFAHAIVHELRGPLNTIAGFSRALELNDAKEMAPAARSRLRRIAEAACSMNQLIDELLTFAAAEHLSARRREVAMDMLVHEVVEGVRGAYPATRVVTSELPVMDVDPLVARVALSNLVSNAFKYSARSPQPLVQIGIDHDGALYVEDNGVGFAQEHAQAIFEPFARVAADPEFTGTGLGLAIARRLVERDGGSIEARSRVGGPTVFRLRLAAA